MESTLRGVLERIHVGAIAAVVFILPLFLWPGLTDYNYAKSIASIVLISLLLVLWGMTAWRRPSWTLRIPWILTAVAGLICFVGVSALRAAAPLVALQSLVLLTCYVLFLWMIANVVRDARDARLILTALFLSGVLAALYGVLQYFGVLPGPAGTANGLPAIVTTMGNRNHLGGFLLYLFFPGVMLLIGGSSRVQKTAVFLALAFVLTTLMALNQVSVYIIFPLLVAALIIGLLIFRAPRPLQANRWWLAGLAAFALALVLCLLGFDQAKTPTEDESFIQALWESNSGKTRAQDWWIAGEMFADRPVYGIGLGHYKIEFLTYKAIFLATARGQSYDRYISRAAQAHNEYIQLGAELGVIGLVLLFASLATLAASLWIRLRHNQQEGRVALLLLVVGVLGFLGHSLVSFPAHVVGSSLAFIVFCGIALSVAYGERAFFIWKPGKFTARALHVALIGFAVTVSSLATMDARANWLMERGIDQVEAGLFATAETTLKQSLSLDFAARQTYYYLGIAQIQLGKLDEAQASLSQCMTYFMDEAALLNYANLLVNTGQSELAFEPLGILLASQPRAEIERRATYLHALALGETGNPQLAIEMIQALLANNPGYETPYIGLGSIYESLGEGDEAYEAYQAGLSLVEEALESARARLEGIALTAPPSRLTELQATIARLVYERATLLERLRALGEVDSP